MGMDLIARNGGFHFNWTGWAELRDELERVGAPIERMDGCNDGRIIPVADLRKWGKLLQAKHGTCSCKDKSKKGFCTEGACDDPGLIDFPEWEDKLRCFAHWCLDIKGPVRQY